MTIRFTCPQCRKTIQAKPEQAGKRFRCPNPECRTAVTVPNADGTTGGSSPGVSLRDAVSSDSAAGEAAASALAEDGVPAVWKSGDVILDLYEVKEKLGKGGFGEVWRVHHRGWNVDLAVKCPRADRFKSERQQQEFVQECETWVTLGLHPHTVSCHYVRILGGIPRVFAEYVAGGSLKDWLALGKVADLKTALDIAIQIAWGMAFAHSKGLIHRDLKPANVLMTPDGTAKVTDFGLARGGEANFEAAPSSSPGGYQVSTGYGTPGYGAPEQWTVGKRVDQRADIFAFGVLLWRLLGGRITWEDEGRKSVVAKHAVTTLLKRGEAPSLAQPLAALILRCLEPEPDDRWPDFVSVYEPLRAVYSKAAGEPHSRLEPQALDLLADGLNNRALSLLDLGDSAGANQSWRQALTVDPLHLEAVYNLGLYESRSARTDGMTFVRQLREAGTNAASWRAAYLAAQVAAEQGDCDGAIRLLQGLDAKELARVELQSLLAYAQEHASRTFNGHVDCIHSVVQIAGSRFVLSGGEDNTLKLWEVPSGRCLRTFEGHTGPVVSVSLSADGRQALSGSGDRTLKLWDVSSGRCLRTIEGHRDVVCSVSLSADGRYGLSGSKDETLMLWKVSTGQCLRKLGEGPDSGLSLGFMDTPWSVCILADGRRAVSGEQSGSVDLWDLATGNCLRTFRGHNGPVCSVSPSKDGRYVLSGSSDRSLRLWDLSLGHCLKTLDGHADAVRSVCLSADGRYALSGCEDRTLKLWDVSSGRCLRTLEGHTASVRSVTLTSENRYALSGSLDGTLRLWEIATSREYRASWELSRPLASEAAAATESRFNQWVNAAHMALQQGDAREAAGMLRRARALPGCRRRKNAFLAWQGLYRFLPRQTLSGGWEVQTLLGHTRAVKSAVMSADCRFALSGSYDNTLRVWDLSNGHCLRSLDGHTGGVTSVSLSPDARYALSGSGDKTLGLWDLSTGTCLRSLRGHTGHVYSVFLAADCCLALSGSGDRTLKLWTVPDGDCRRTFDGHLDAVMAVSLAADGSCAVSGSADKTLKLWDVSSGRCLRTFEGHRDVVASVTLSSDGRFAMSGSDDGSLKLWDVATGRCLRTFEGHGDVVASVTLSSDGRFAMSGSDDKTLKLWEIATGRCLRTFEGHAETVCSVGFSADGSYALSGSGDRTVKLWALDWDLLERDPADWDERARVYVKLWLSTVRIPASAVPLDLESILEQEIGRHQTADQQPIWSEDDFQRLLHTLGCAGFGWLRPEGVRRELEKMAADWTGPPPLVTGNP